MTSKSIRDAAQALLDAVDQTQDPLLCAKRLREMRTALAAPEPTADERLAEHMRHVRECMPAEWVDKYGEMHVIEQSARSLLGASQEEASPRLTNAQIDAIADATMEPCDSGDAATDDLDRVVLRRFARASIRAAMKGKA